jgi:hypothetical protein
VTNLPFKKQLLPANPVEQIEHKLAQGEVVSGSELLAVIEQAQGRPLDDRLRDVVRRFSFSAAKRRGRPNDCKGKRDFALEEVDERYPAVLEKYQEQALRKRRLAEAGGDVLASAEPTPSERAYTEILQGMQAHFPNTSWRALCNMHTKWKNGRFHPDVNHVDSEDFEAEIERQFPAPQRRS